MRANIRDKSFVIILMNKFGQHDVREQVPVFAFLQCGAHKQQTCCTGVTTCSKWEWKKTRFYKGSWHNSKCRPHRSLSPPTIPPQSPISHIQPR
jgi:hypothetical protein